ncbi:MAG TPA: glycoside hydrolase family 28 protein [Bacteroidales bacterium]
MSKNVPFSILLLTCLLLPVSMEAVTSKAHSNYDITKYGAVGDGITLNTTKIQNAIDECSKAGGGLVTVPAGKFITGAIFLKQGVSLRIEKEGVLKGSVNQKDYPQIDTRWEGEERVWTSALINIIDVNNVEISGEGTIDGSGTEWPGFGRQNTAPRPQLSQASRDSISRIPRLGRPRLICFQNCTKVRISDLNLRNQAVWCLHILYSKDVIVKNLDIRAAHTIPSSDGIDVDSSNGVTITGCYIDDNDDCISIKSGKDADGLRVNRPSENIVIKKCRFGYGHGGVAMGSETSGGIRNVKILNCDVDSGNWAPIRFKTQPSRSGVVENIVYKNIRIKAARQAFEFNMEWRMVPPVAPPAKVLAIVRNVRFINVSGNVNTLGVIHGLKDSPITDVKFIRCKLKAQKGLVVDNVKDIDYSGLSAEVKEGKVIINK